jgi:beta-lactamase regulating signal transducer with metallopeptidase domain/biopolymer transport protein ExbD
MIDLVNRLGSEWGTYFGYAIAQNTLFLCLIWVSLRLLKGASARLKYSICLVGLVKLLLPPFIPASFGVGSSPSLSQNAGVTVALPPSTDLTGASTLLSHPTHLSLPGLLLIVWAGGLLLYLAAALTSTLRLRATLASAAPIDGNARRGGPRDRVRIFKSDRIAVPLTFGPFPRRIYVPAVWDTWSDKCRRMVITHEIAHIRRWDGLSGAFQVLAGALYFFNPMVWWLNLEMNRYREMACDDAVVAGGSGGALEYSRYLVGLAETAAMGPRTLGPASALVRNRRRLLERIHYQMEEKTMAKRSKKRRGLVFAALFAFILPLSWYCGGPETGQDPKANLEAASLGKYKGMQIVQVAVKADGKITVDGNATTLEDLGRALDGVTGGDTEKTLVVLTSADGVMMNVIREIQDILVEKNLRKVIYDKDAAGFDDLTLILPSESDQKRLEQIPKEHIAVLEMGPASRASLDGKALDLFDIPKAIKARISEDPYLIVVIRSPGTSPFDDFATALALAKKGGATRISIDVLPFTNQ